MADQEQDQDQGQEQETPVYYPADSVAELAQELIKSHHHHLITARFRFLFKDKDMKKGGRVVLGSVKKASAELQYLLDIDFLMVISLPTWNPMEEKARRACVDHLLERCWGEESEKTGAWKWSLREPDVNEFSTILSRYGAWTTALQDFVKVSQDIDLSFMTEGFGESQPQTH